MRGIFYLIVGIIVLSFALGAYIYPYLPDVVASHWNAQGVADGYMPKFFAVFIMPVISVFLLVLFMVLPRIDPKKKNIEKFRTHFDIFIFIVFLFLFYINALFIIWNLGVRFDFIQVLSPGFALLFYYCGILMEHSKRNWFIGMRTPWTMSSDKVWDKTHKLGGILLRVCGLLALVALFFPQYAIFIILVPIILCVIYLFIYSYFEYEKIKKK
jgi:uncharacterized membrane protein